MPIKLKAKDYEDVQVMSAVLQDAIAPVCDMMFDTDEKNFVMVVHRLMRETAQSDIMERIRCGVNIRGVTMAQLHGINLNQQNRMLDLLAVITDEQSMMFVFAGDAKIRLQLQDWSMVVEDFGEPWPAQCRPCHEGDSGFGAQGSKKRQ